MPAALLDDDPLARLLRALLAIDLAKRIQSGFELNGILNAMGHMRPEFRTSLPGRDAAATPGGTRRRLSR